MSRDRDRYQTRPRGADLARRDARPPRRGPRAHARGPRRAETRTSAGGGSASSRSHAADARAAPGPARGPGASSRSTACGRTSSRTAATSSSWVWRTASPICCSRAAATAVRVVGLDARAGDRRRRSRRTHPICSGSRSRGRGQGARAAEGQLPRLADRAGDAGIDLGLGPARRRPGHDGARRAACLLVANVAGTLLAYRDSCAGCGALDRRASCSTTARSHVPGVLGQFSLPLAGRALGPEDLQLEPVPLLEDDGRVRVAVRRDPRPRPAPRGRQRGEAAAPTPARGALRPVRHRGARRPPPPAAARGAPDPVHLRELLRAALGRSAATGRPAAASSGSTGSTWPTSCGPGSRSRSASRSSSRASVADGQVAAFYPEPRRRHRERARPRLVARAGRREPRARHAGARRPRR